MSISIPTLQLIFDKGPRKGERLQCKPCELTRIGRVVRGNTLAVKDQGISQKHLLLTFLPDISRWAVTDLDTSNGTLVNALPIPPSTPSPLADGDIIKIGETTSISVHISEASQAVAPPPTRRRGRSAKEDAPDPEPEAAVAEPTVGRSVRRGRAAAASEVTAVPVVEAISARRSTRRGKRAGVFVTELEKELDCALDPIVEVTAEQVVEEAVPPRRNTRRGKRAGVFVTELEKELDCARDPIVEVTAEPVVEEAVPLRRNTRRGKRAHVSVMEVEKEVLDCPPIVEVGAELVVEEAVLPRRSTRRGKRVDVPVAEPAKEDILHCVQNPIVEIAAVECGEEVTRGMGKGRGMRKGRGRGRGRGIGATETRTTQSSVLGEDGRSCPVPEVVAAVQVEAKQVNGMRNDDGDGDGVEEVRVVEPPAEEMGDDWENMTVGQWLDRMETLLPQGIKEATEEKIAELRSMSLRFDAECLRGI